MDKQKIIEEIIETIAHGICSGYDGSNPFLSFNAKVRLKELLLKLFEI